MVLFSLCAKWTDGKVGYLIRKANTSWVHRKWGASVVQLNPDTWVLEYRRSSVLDDSRLFLAAVEFLKYRISKMVRSLKQEFWFFSHALRSNHFSQFTSKYDTKIPTWRKAMGISQQCQVLISCEKLFIFILSILNFLYCDISLLHCMLPYPFTNATT